ncbi:MAG: hypothetical protein ACI8YQ_000454 [Polaribacter sp.]|jgi:hypothetical protein
MINPLLRIARPIFTAVFLTAFCLGIQAQCVYLKQLNGSQKAQDNLLTWTTLTETNNAFFLIERSLNGINFEEAGRVEGVASDQTKNQYSFTDIDNQGLRVFYRLAEVSMDGDVSFTNTVLVNRKGEDIVFEINSIESSITDQFFNMTLTSSVDAPMEYRLQTRMGEILKVGKVAIVAGQNALSVDLHEVKVGTYQFSIRIKNEIEVIALQKVDETMEVESILSVKEDDK